MDRPYDGTLQDDPPRDNDNVGGAKVTDNARLGDSQVFNVRHLVFE